MQLLSVRDIEVSFGKRKVLDGIDFEINSGVIASISGRSGSGKTTLLGILAGLMKPESGEVLFNGEDIFRWNDFKRSRYRNRKVGFVFQSFNLLPDLTVYQNVSYPRTINRFSSNKNGEIDELLQVLGIDDLRNHFPSTLSGGEQQRVAIARAIINRPEIIIADEPTGNLDNETGKSIFNLFCEIKEKYEIAVIIATHERHIIRNSDQYYHLKEGKLISKRA